MAQTSSAREVPLGGSSPGSAPNIPHLPAGSGVEPIPSRVGRFEIERMLGYGGMGVVYRGFDPELHRHVAIKMVLDTTHMSAEDLERFLREARAAARLRHAGIVNVHHVGVESGKPYLVMDCVDGESLELKVAGGPLPQQTAAEIVRQVACALDHAHQHGIIHRDVKPENILVDRFGQARLTDFGLARDTATRRRITMSGVAVGTPLYMAPEQATGETAEQGPRTDVFALGAVLYRAIAGAPPFGGDTPLAVIQNVVNTAPAPPRRIDPAIDADLETIVLRCLEKEPDDRYATARALAEDLQRYLDKKAIAARPIGRIGRIRRWGRRNPKSSTAAAIFGMAFLSLPLVAAAIAKVRVQQAERARAATELDRAKQKLRAEAVRDARAAAEARWEALEEVRRQTAGKRTPAAVGARLGAALEAWAAAGRRVEVEDDELEARAGLVRASIALAEVAAELEQWPTAYAAIDEAMALGPKGEQANALSQARVRVKAAEDAAREAHADAQGAIPDERLELHYRALRRAMADRARERGVKDPRILAAMAQVPRHVFVPDLLGAAHGDAAVPAGPAGGFPAAWRTAQMLELADLEPNDRVLVVGGAGYTAALLARLVRRVYAIEPDHRRARAVEAAFPPEGAAKVTFLNRDGLIGYVAAGPFDAIVVCGALRESPKLLLEQLKPNGSKLVAPIAGRLVVFTRDGERKSERVVEEGVAFEPLEGFKAPPRD